MNRPKLFAIARENGWRKGRPMSAETFNKVQKALRAQFATPEGLRDLEDAPRENVSDRGEDKYRRMSAAAAVRALMEEL